MKRYRLSDLADTNLDMEVDILDLGNLANDYGKTFFP